MTGLFIRRKSVIKSDRYDLKLFSICRLLNRYHIWKHPN